MSSLSVDTFSAILLWMEQHVLPVLLLVPLAGVGFLLLLNRSAPLSQIRASALFFSGLAFIISLWLWASFDESILEYQFVYKKEWLSLGDIPIHFALGVDGLSLFFVPLSTLLVFLALLVSWPSVQKNFKAYYITFLLGEFFIVGAFCALDIVLFYFFFEGVLLPMVMIIGVWGGENRAYATTKFFLYTLFGSLLFLGAILLLIQNVGSGDLTTIIRSSFSFSFSLQVGLWLACFASFAIKIPMFPFHTWLPDAHVEAPTAGSVILAGILLKLGGYGFLRIALPAFPDATLFFSPLMMGLSLCAALYAAFIALAQTDIKRTIAYSSIAHMGLVTLGMFSLSHLGVTGAIFSMLSHGVVSGGLFIVIGCLYDRLHTRQLDGFGGIAQRMPLLATSAMILMLSSIGLPGTGGFIGELYIFLGSFSVHPFLTVGAVGTLVFSAAYMLWWYGKIMFGSPQSSEILKLTDLRPNEVFSLGGLSLLILWMGIYPLPFLNPMVPAVEALLSRYKNEDCKENVEHEESALMKILPEASAPKKMSIHL